MSTKKCKEEGTQLLLYIKRTPDMMKTGRRKFNKTERPRIQIGVNQFIFADELPKYLIENFKFPILKKKKQKAKEKVRC